MTRTLPRLSAAALLAFALAAAGFLVLRGSDAPLPVSGGAPPSVDARAASSTDAEIARLQRALRADPRAASAMTGLAGAYLQKARETADPAYYIRAERLLARRPGDPGALTLQATLALARHDFRSGLRLARRARAAQPQSLAAYPALVDALVELGRYGAAESALQRVVDLKPTLAAYARVSYLRELHGDLDGAVSAMRRAVAAGGPAPETVASVQALLGGLELVRGRPGAARAAHRAALAGVPGLPAAHAGLARVAAAQGNLPAAIAAWRRLVDRLPLPEYVTGLGEAELAAGRRAAARRDFALIGAQERLLAAAGVNTDAELALFEADHGSARRAVALGRRAWAAAPSVRSADALGWALTRAGRPLAGLRWARQALRLGSRDPLVRFHAGMTARAAGHARAGRRDLRLALAHGLDGWPWEAARARAALAR
jgi:tetratricopeptide (TPR) repeat protein